MTIQKSLKDMFKEIESAQLRNPDLDYSELINELNEILDRHKTLVATRTSINRCRAMGIDDTGDNVEDEADNNTHEPDEPDNSPDEDTEGDI